MRIPLREAGFTLVELVMVLLLIGLLAVVAAPKLTSKDFDVRGFHDGTMAALRYAQKSAIAQRRTVCVAFTANSVTLTMAASAGSTACPANGMTGSDGKNPAQVVGAAGVSYVVQPVDFYFDALGQPSGGRTFDVQGNGVALNIPIVVEPGTGYVHD